MFNTWLLQFIGQDFNHYGNLPLQYTEIFSAVKLCKNCNILYIFAQNIDCGHTSEQPWLELLRRGGSIEYPQSMFWIKNKKNRYTPVNPSFTISKFGLRGYTFHRHVFLMLNSHLQKIISVCCMLDPQLSKNNDRTGLCFVTFTEIFAVLNDSLYRCNVIMLFFFDTIICIFQSAIFRTDILDVR